MADTKITALTALTGADPANDVIPIVDVSDTTMAASGTTKKISVNNILGASGTATLASATITGDLTVDTNVLKVDTTNNRVGIGTASPIDVFQISSQNPNIYLTDSGIAGSDQVNLYFGPNTIPTYSGILVDISNDNFNIRHNSSTRLSIGSTGIFTWQNVGGVAGTAMTLNSTGLGIGVTPSAWGVNFKALEIGGSGTSLFSGAGATPQTYLTSNAYFNGTSWIYKVSNSSMRYEQGAAGHLFYTAPSGTAGNAITFTQAMTLDASGSLVLGAAAVATTATDGFLYIPGCAGTPTGTPTAKTGRVPLVVDTTNNKLYFYSGGAWVAAN